MKISVYSLLYILAFGLTFAVGEHLRGVPDRVTIKTKAPTFKIPQIKIPITKYPTKKPTWKIITRPVGTKSPTYKFEGPGNIGGIRTKSPTYEIPPLPPAVSSSPAPSEGPTEKPTGYLIEPPIRRTDSPTFWTPGNIGIKTKAPTGYLGEPPIEKTHSPTFWTPGNIGIKTKAPTGLRPPATRSPTKFVIDIPHDYVPIPTEKPTIIKTIVPTGIRPITRSPSMMVDLPHDFIPIRTNSPTFHIPPPPEPITDAPTSRRVVHPHEVTEATKSPTQSPIRREVRQPHDIREATRSPTME